MAWTAAQSEANAAVNAQEFANRQIVLRGSGPPTVQGPEGLEYLDESTSPHTCYRKMGPDANAWTVVNSVVPATQTEVSDGVVDNKMVTPATLAATLNDFAVQVLAIPPQEAVTQTGLVSLLASTPDDSAAFEVTLPEGIQEEILSVEIGGYGLGASLFNINGGPIAQLVSIRRADAGILSIVGTTHIRISAALLLDDSQMLDNITLQRISSTEWVEVARKEF